MVPAWDLKIPLMETEEVQAQMMFYEARSGGVCESHQHVRGLTFVSFEHGHHNAISWLLFRSHVTCHLWSSLDWDHARILDDSFCLAWMMWAKLPYSSSTGSGILSAVKAGNMERQGQDLLPSSLACFLTRKAKGFPGALKQAKKRLETTFGLVKNIF